jgi:ABC-2 type transport system ATP-binding protein
MTTHYMEEAERLCDRVAIIDGGRIIALGSPRELIARLGGQHVVEFSLQDQGTVPFGSTLPTDSWNELPGVTGCRYEGGIVHLSANEPHVVLPALLESLARRGWRLASLTTRHASLDDVFIMLTGRQLEAEGAEEAEKPLC